jgi:hypothetical protein
MKERGLTISEIILLGGTRVALGVGVGLLIGRQLNDDQRKAAGTALTVVGALTTIPILINIIKKPELAEKIAA